MERRIEDVQYCERLFQSFYDIGSTSQGGVTRLGYSETEDTMHEVFKGLGRELGASVITDEVGNTYVTNTDEDGYTLIGSHLDSVIEGGRYDGVAGVMAGLMVMRWALRVGAFRCEESSNFGCCTIGSGLITHEVYKQDIGHLMSKDGESLESIFERRGLTLHPKKISGLRRYLELHIEQGKVLEECKTQVGIVGTIAGPVRYRVYLRGMAEHSGATPMDMRSDALCAAAEIILEMEKIGKWESAYQSVATVGVVQNHPNVLNVIPGRVELGVDMRGIDQDSLDRMERAFKAAVRESCKKRGVEYVAEKINSIPPISMSESVEDGLEQAAKRLGISSRRMPSGAGHDAMSFAEICDSGMVFIPCRGGVSHNPSEHAEITSICDGARVMYEYLKEETAK